MHKTNLFQQCFFYKEKKKEKERKEEKGSSLNVLYLLQHFLRFSYVSHIRAKEKRTCSLPLWNMQNTGEKHRTITNVLSFAIGPHC